MPLLGQRAPSAALRKRPAGLALDRGDLIRRGVLGAGSLLLFLLVLVVGAVDGRVWAVAVGALGAALCEVWLHRVLAPALPRQVDVLLGEL